MPTAPTIDPPRAPDAIDDAAVAAAADADLIVSPRGLRADVPEGLRVGSHLRFVDGLRALAVLAVVVYHMNESFLTGGFVGVDVFFVISGFVITKSILHGAATRGFSVLRFYGARIRRIMPAALLVTSVVIAASYVLFTWLEQQQFLQQKPWWAFVHASNIAFTDIQVAYGDIEGFQNPLLHTWSLGVENQFYLVWPLLVALVFGVTRSVRVLLAAVLLISATSLALMLRETDSTAAFYLPQMRIWQVALGAAAALVDPTWFTAIARKAGAVGRVAMRLLVAVSFLVIFEFMVRVEFASAERWRAVPASVATAIILLVLTRSEQVRGIGAVLSTRLLSLRPVAFVGLISYSLYLWHWPLLTYLRVWGFQVERLASASAATLLGVLILLSWLSWRLVEEPARRVRRLVPLVAIVAVLVAGGMAIGPRLTVDESRKVEYAAYHPRYQAALEQYARWQRSLYGGPTLAMLDNGSYVSHPALAPGQVDMLVVGNSHMEQFELLTAKLAGRAQLRSVFIGSGGQTFGEHARSRAMLEHILATSNVRVLVVDFTRGEPSMAFVEDLLDQVGRSHPDTRVLLLKDNPTTEFMPNACRDFTRLGALLQRVRDRPWCTDLGFSKASLEQADAFEDRLGDLLTAPNMYYVDDYYERLVDRGDVVLPAGRRRAPATGIYRRGELLFYDNSHYSYNGYLDVEPMLLAEIDDLGVFDGL